MTCIIVMRLCGTLPKSWDTGSPPRSASLRESSMPMNVRPKMANMSAHPHTRLCDLCVTEAQPVMSTTGSGQMLRQGGGGCSQTAMSMSTSTQKTPPTAWTKDLRMSPRSCRWARGSAQPATQGSRQAPAVP